MSNPSPFSFSEWLNTHKAQLKPPVGNKVLWPDSEFIAMVVAGPNARSDFHINQGEELFFQIRGDITLKIFEDQKITDIQIKQGECFRLPANTPHSPQRPAGTIGFVLERKRHEGEQDGLAWFCPKCFTKLYEEYFILKNIEKDFPPVFDRFFNNSENCTCKKCNIKVTR